MRKFNAIVLIATVFFSGCATMGNNSSFSLLYKRQLRNYYMDLVNCETKDNPKDKNKCKQNTPETLADMEAYLPPLYTTNLPFIMSEMWDTRGREPIRIGEPLNVIINKIHLKDNGSIFGG
ncbi:MAG: hypothetical protein HY026_02770 [Deltaproteobacteria bacterium]|nr:hypothetical protein [Deltaproteobacteria bacterium]